MIDEGQIPPNMAYMPCRLYVAIRIYCGDKYPRKMKKWAIGTRRSRRRDSLRFLEALRKPLKINLVVERVDLQVGLDTQEQTPVP